MSSAANRTLENESSETNCQSMASKLYSGAKVGEPDAAKDGFGATDGEFGFEAGMSVEATDDREFPVSGTNAGATDRLDAVDSSPNGPRYPDQRHARTKTDATQVAVVFAVEARSDDGVAVDSPARMLCIDILARRTHVLIVPVDRPMTEAASG